MSFVVSTIWDFDKTLIKWYMQAPMFKQYGVEAKDFWAENDLLFSNYREARPSEILCPRDN